MNRQLRLPKTALCTAMAVALLVHPAIAETEPGFASLFDGQTLKGWTYVGDTNGPYVVQDGVIVCPANGSGDLYADGEFSDFVLRLDFKVSAGGNNGVGIRCPLGKPGEQMAYSGMEIQVLDDKAPKHANIKIWQHNGSVYGLIPAKNGAPKIGEWNSYEITAKGRSIKVVLNGRAIVDGNLNDVHDPEVLGRHLGMFRDGGRIAFLGHHSRVEFRNIRIKELPHIEKDNTPPDGFTPLFNGKDFRGWKGLVGNPKKRAAMPPDELAAELTKADQIMRTNWMVEDGAVVYRGKGFDNLCTAKDYDDFELLVDWKIQAKGDSGLYLRGCPQVQIWEPHSPGQFNPPDGSGGLYNNQKNPRHPLHSADKPVGEWNRFRVVMVGDKVHVFLNGQCVVANTTLENYWERDKPMYATGQIELQSHKEPVWFKNVYVREITHDAK